MPPPLTVERLTAAARTLKAIAHPERLRLVQTLEKGRRPVHQLVRELGLPQAVVSKHLAVLRRAGVARSEVRGNFRYYGISNRNVLAVLDCMRRHG